MVCNKMDFSGYGTISVLVLPSYGKKKEAHSGVMRMEIELDQFWQCYLPAITFTELWSLCV